MEGMYALSGGGNSSVEICCLTLVLDYSGVHVRGPVLFVPGTCLHCCTTLSTNVTGRISWCCLKHYSILGLYFLPNARVQFLTGSKAVDLGLRTHKTVQESERPHQEEWCTAASTVPVFISVFARDIVQR